MAPGPTTRPYASAALLGGTKLIQDLAATCRIDSDGRKYLEVEAGTEGIGPTYRLYAAVVLSDGLAKADVDVDPDELVLIPDAWIGHYDDSEDDHGVPWAYPLHPLEQEGR